MTWVSLLYAINVKYYRIIYFKRNRREKMEKKEGQSSTRAHADDDVHDDGRGNNM